jgi:hypothetical protein
MIVHPSQIEEPVTWGMKVQIPIRMNTYVLNTS